MKIDPAASAAMPTSHGLGARLAGSSELDPFGKRNRNHRQHNSRHRRSNELPHSRRGGRARRRGVLPAPRKKLALGLADAPPERAPVESQSEEALIAQALAEREERARTEKMRLTSLDPQEIWADYTVTNAASGKSYRLALRGWRPGESYCSCPDFRKNTLGTCKHILHALEKVRRRFPDSVRDRPYRQRDICVHLSYSKELELRILLPHRLDEKASAIVRPIRDRALLSSTTTRPAPLS